jgi:hypothetical protein
MVTVPKSSICLTARPHLDGDVGESEDVFDGELGQRALHLPLRGFVVAAVPEYLAREIG